MIAYKAIGFRPPTLSPVRPRTIGQLTSTQAKAIDAGATLVGAAYGAGVAWVGFYTGSKASGLLSILGYVVGVGGALRSALDVLDLVLMATGAGMQTTTPQTPAA